MSAKRCPPPPPALGRPPASPPPLQRGLFTDNLLVRIHGVIEMIWWTDLAPWEFEFPFLGSLVCTFLCIEPTCVGRSEVTSNSCSIFCAFNSRLPASTSLLFASSVFRAASSSLFAASASLFASSASLFAASCAWRKTSEGVRAQQVCEDEINGDLTRQNGR